MAEHRVERRLAAILAADVAGCSLPMGATRTAPSPRRSLIGPNRRRRDRLIPALSGAGFEVTLPEGTFYLTSRWPDGDPDALWNALADRDVFVMPGTILNAPEYLRICLTASDEMIDKALPIFETFGGAGPVERRPPPR